MLSAECAGCKAKDAVIAELMKLVQGNGRVFVNTSCLCGQPGMYCPVHTASNTAGKNYADRCPCNPANGGSGVCGCINGGPRVTC